MNHRKFLWKFKKKITWEELRTSTAVCVLILSYRSEMSIFDFQQNLPLPHIPVGEVFYKYQLWLYMFGIHDCVQLWIVGLSSYPKKGNDKVISHLDMYLSKLPDRVTALYLYSDGCPGKNENIYLVRYLFWWN